MSAKYSENPGRPKLVGIVGGNGKITAAYMKEVIEKCTGERVALSGAECCRNTQSIYEFERMLDDAAQAGCGWVIAELPVSATGCVITCEFQFEAGIFNDFGDDAEYDGEELSAECARLFSSCKVAVINIDGQLGESLAGAVQCPVLTYSADKNEAGITAKNIRYSESGLRFCILSTGKLWRAEIHLTEREAVLASLAAAGIGIFMKADAKEIAAALYAVAEISDYKYCFDEFYSDVPENCYATGA